MKNFKEKVLSMTASEIVQAMVDGLKNPKVEVDMDTFGKKIGGICFGCAATCTLLEIADINNIESFPVSNHFSSLAYTLEVEHDFILFFEYAIDMLRTGNIGLYNLEARKISMAEISFYAETNGLPSLQTIDYKYNLHHYEELAKRLKAYEEKTASSNSPIQPKN